MKALQISNLAKTYPGNVQALKGIDFTIEEGDFFALLGPNGAGKSTTINVIASLIKATSGSVKIFGHDIRTDMVNAKKHLGLVPQEFNFGIFEQVEDIVINQAGFYGIPRRIAQQRAKQYLTQLGLWDKRKAQGRELSGGMKRRLLIARALMHKPKLLILDEPTAGVDIELRRSMWEFLNEVHANGTTIILTTHYLEEAENHCNNVAIIDQGEIIENTSINELLSRLDKEAFILNTVNKLVSVPSLGTYNLKQLGENMLEVELTKEHGLNDLFSALSAHDIRISSMRNKSNRLEELFINLTSKGDRS